MAGATQQGQGYRERQRKREEIWGAAFIEVED